jgi:hypothetical protein
MRAGLIVLVCGLLGLVGCGGGGPIVSTVTQPIAPLPGAALTGIVSSGSQPVVGAHVYLLAANTTGYESSSSSSTNASVIPSVSVVGAAEPGTTQDTSGGATNGDYYVTTGANGQFSLTGDYACSSGQQLYLYSLGGNTGSGVNSAAGLMAALGSCPSSSSPAISVTVNEVSTVAAAYALAGFATDATHVSSSGTALAQIGVANAFANAGNLVNLATGTALATTPAGNGTVPQAEINTLANVLASCVNTNGIGSGACSTLFTDTGLGGSSATAPDTAMAAISIAHHPGANVASLYGLAAANPSFAPGLTSAPNDLTVALVLTSGGVNHAWGIAIDGSGNAWIADALLPSGVTEFSSSGAVLSDYGYGPYTRGGLDVPEIIAIDDSGDAWISNSYDNTVTEFSNSGSILSGTNGYVLPGASGYGGSGVAIAGSGNAWTVNSTSNSITLLSPTGSVLSGANGFTGGGLDGAGSVAIDGSGDAWVTSYSGNSVAKVSPAGSFLSGASGFTGGGLDSPWDIAIDGSGDAWILNFWIIGTAPLSFGGSVTKLSNSGTSLSGTVGFTGGGLSYPQALSIDGSGNVWVANNYQATTQLGVVELSSSGTFLSGANGYIGPSLGETRGGGGIAVDGSGDVWVTSWLGVGFVVEFVGAATPVITPIVAGLPATPTADGSSNLGTRP